MGPALVVKITLAKNLSTGLNDSEGRDTEHIANIIEKLKDGKFITTFLIVRNGAEQRMNKAYSDMLRIFELGFGVINIGLTTESCIDAFHELGQFLEPCALRRLLCGPLQRSETGEALD